MDWVAIGAIGEFVGGVVVIVTVVYLAMQLRTANRQAEASTQIEWTRGLNEIWDRWAVKDTQEALRKGFSDFDRLSKSEQTIFQMQVGSLVNHLEVAQDLAAKGLLPESYKQTSEEFMIMVLGTPGGLQYWERDSKATPGGDARLDSVRSRSSEVPSFRELFPWWSSAE